MSTQTHKNSGNQAYVNAMRLHLLCHELAYDYPSIKELIEHADIDFEARDLSGRTCLMSVLSSPHRLDWVALHLINRGAKTDVKDNHGVSAIYLAAQRYHATLVIDMHKAGANMNDVGPHNESVLMALLKGGIDKYALCDVLHYDCDVNQCDDNGVSPLMIAASINAKINSFFPAEKIAILYNKGANINARDKSGRSVLDYAESTQKILIINAVKECLTKDAIDNCDKCPRDIQTPDVIIRKKPPIKFQP